MDGMTEPLLGSNNSVSDDQDRLGQGTELRTILSLSAGPFLAELVGGAHALIDSFWISRVCGEDGLAALALCSLYDLLGQAFGYFLCVAASSQFSRLRGERRHEAFPQLFADILRFAVVCGLIWPAIALPTIRPFLKFLGATGQVQDYGFQYLVPLVSGCIVQCFSMTLCGILQSEGRSVIFGAVQISGFVLNFAVFDPLFLLVFKMELFGAGLAVVCARAVPLACLSIAFLLQKFETRTHCRCFVTMFSAPSWEAAKTGFTQYSSYVCYYLPAVIVQKYVTLAADASGQYEDVVASYNVVMKVWPLDQAFATALPEGLLPATSYAVAAGRPKRVLRLALWSVVLVFGWCSFTEAILIGFGDQIAGLFTTSPAMVTMARRLVVTSYLLSCLTGEVGVTTVMLQATKRNGFALLFAVFTQMVPVPLFATILYFTDPSRDVYRLMYMWVGGDGLNFVTSMIFMTIPLREMWKIRDTEIPAQSLYTVPGE
jgi:Na+-driven multidrug efflux pump